MPLHNSFSQNYLTWEEGIHIRDAYEKRCRVEEEIPFEIENFQYELQCICCRKDSSDDYIQNRKKYENTKCLQTTVVNGKKIQELKEIIEKKEYF